MQIAEPFAGVRALESGLSCVKGVVLDNRLWRYMKRARGEHLVAETSRRLQRRSGEGAGLLVLRGRFSGIHGEPDDAALLMVAERLRDNTVLDYCNTHRRWPDRVRAVLGEHEMEIVVRRPDALLGPWDVYAQHEAEQDVLHEAREILEEAVADEDEKRRTALTAEVERRLLRAGVTFTTGSKPLRNAPRHPVTGDVLNGMGKVVEEADVHEATDWDDVVMSYATLLRLLKMIDPRFEN